MSTPVPPTGPDGPTDPYGAPDPGAHPAAGGYPQPGAAYPGPGPDHPGAPAATPWQPPMPAPTSTFAIVALVVAAIPCTALVGLVLSIVALVQANRGRASGKGLAITGIVVGALWIAAGIAALGLGFGTLWSTCSELGDGVHQVDGITYTCNV
jgi:hypothetical protein